VEKRVTDKDLEMIKANVQQGLKTLTNELDRRLIDLRKQVQEINNSPGSRQMLRLSLAFAIGLAVGVAISRRGK
jgi:hypothetical protein